MHIIVGYPVSSRRIYFLNLIFFDETSRLWSSITENVMGDFPDPPWIFLGPPGIKKGLKRGQIDNFPKTHHLKPKFGTVAKLYSRNSMVAFISAKSHVLTHFFAPQGSNGGQNGQRLPVS